MNTYTDSKGYIREKCPEHPNAYADGFCMQHRLVVERSLSRLLNVSEHVHHINGIVTDNRIENLRVVTPSEHGVIHAPLRRQIQYIKKSNFIGVFYKKNRPKCWGATLCVNGIKYQTPLFRTEAEAAQAYDALVLKHLPDGKRNFPEQTPPENILEKKYGSIRHELNGKLYSNSELIKMFKITKAKYSMMLYRGKTIQQIHDLCLGGVKKEAFRELSEVDMNANAPAEGTDYDSLNDNDEEDEE